MRLNRLVALISTVAVLAAACGFGSQANTSPGTLEPTATPALATATAHPTPTPRAAVEPTAGA